MRSQFLPGIPNSKRFCEVLLIIPLFEPRVLEIDDLKSSRAAGSGPEGRLHQIDRGAAASTGQHEDVPGFRLGRGGKWSKSEDHEDDSQKRRARRDTRAAPRTGAGAPLSCYCRSRACHGPAV